MAKQLKSLGIDFTFFDATDLKDADTDQLFTLYSRDRFPKANPYYHRKKGRLRITSSFFVPPPKLSERHRVIMSLATRSGADRADPNDGCC